MKFSVNNMGILDILDCLLGFKGISGSSIVINSGGTFKCRDVIISPCDSSSDLIDSSGTIDCERLQMLGANKSSTGAGCVVDLKARSKSTFNSSVFFFFFLSFFF
jgi:hypothetical protein